MCAERLTAVVVPHPNQDPPGLFECAHLQYYNFSSDHTGQAHGSASTTLREHLLAPPKPKQAYTVWIYSGPYANTNHKR